MSLAPDILLAQSQAVLQATEAVLEGHCGQVGSVGGQAEAVSGAVGSEGVGGLEAAGEIVDASHGLVLTEADGLLALGLGGADHLGPEAARLRDDPGVLGGRGGQAGQAAEQEGLHGGWWPGCGRQATGSGLRPLALYTGQGSGSTGWMGKLSIIFQQPIKTVHYI